MTDFLVNDNYRVDQVDSRAHAGAILQNMLEVSQPVMDDTIYPGYSIYHIEVGPIGFSVSASVVRLGGGVKKWQIRTWSTYNV